MNATYEFCIYMPITLNEKRIIEDETSTQFQCFAYFKILLFRFFLIIGGDLHVMFDCLKIKLCCV